MKYIISSCVLLFADEVGTRIKTFPFPKGAPPLLTELPELLLDELIVLWKLVSPSSPIELDPEFKPFPPSIPAKSQLMIISSSFSEARSITQQLIVRGESAHLALPQLRGEDGGRQRGAVAAAVTVAELSAGPGSAGVAVAELGAALRQDGDSGEVI